MRSSDVMTGHQAASASPYRWVILALVWLANTSGALIQLSGAPVQLAVAGEFQLNAAQVATWLNLPLLSIAVLAIPAGLAVDRIGGRALMGIALLVMGVFGCARGLAPGFFHLSIATFLFGLGEAILLSGMPKVVGEWFPPREVGRAVGIYTSGAAVGVLLVFLGAPPLFGQNWRQLFLASGVVALAALAAWLVLGRSGATGSGASTDQQGRLASDLRHLLRLKNVRLLAVMCACLQVALFSWLALGFPFLVLVKGASAEAAGAVVSLTMLGFLAGATLTPALSDRLGRRRPFFTTLATAAAVGLMALPSLPVGAAMWAVVVLLGFSFGTIQVLLFALPLELPGVGRHQVGACGGIVISLGFLAGIASSPALGAILGDFDTATAGQFQVVWLILAAVMLALAAAGAQLTESGWKGRAQPGRDARVSP